MKAEILFLIFQTIR